MKTPRAGVGGPWFVVCAALLVGGLGLEFTTDAAPAFWIGAKPGAAAAIGAGAAVFAVIAANLARLTLARRGEGSDDADRS
ncbi:MAG: hypothetical protein ABL883_10770 [Terricaulis sp.]